MDIKGAKEKVEKEIRALRKEKKKGIRRICVEIEECDPLLWLRSQKFEKIFYWKDRSSSFSVSALGELISIKGGKIDEIFGKIKEYLERYPEIRFFGGSKFPSKKRGDEWILFPDCYFFIPEFELVEKDRKTFLVCNIRTPVEDSFLERLEKIEEGKEVKEANKAIYSERLDKPDKEKWKEMVREVIEEIERKELVKLVLARRSTFRLLNPFDVFSFLKDQREESYHLIFQPAKGISFISMSPERIYFRKDIEIETEAVAGTRKRGSNEKEDREISEELRKSKKELLEHRLVSKVLEEKMRNICSSFSIKEKEAILKLSYMQHLCTRFSGRLMPNVSDQDIIKSIYPNPAIGGYPVERAVEKINKIEEFDRGWYSGVFGWIGKESAEFIVTIRSALILEDKMHIYSGAGIVEGSDPEKEWEELNSKIENFTSALRCLKT